MSDHGGGESAFRDLHGRDEFSRDTPREWLEHGVGDSARGFAVASHIVECDGCFKFITLHFGHTIDLGQAPFSRVVLT